jgi:hypothetical protein
MIAGEPTMGLRLSVDEWPVARPAYTYILPQLALAFAFKQKLPELTISYEEPAAFAKTGNHRIDHSPHKRCGLPASHRGRRRLLLK